MSNFKWQNLEWIYKKRNFFILHKMKVRFKGKSPRQGPMSYGAVEQVFNSPWSDSEVFFLSFLLFLSLFPIFSVTVVTGGKQGSAWLLLQLSVPVLFAHSLEQSNKSPLYRVMMFLILWNQRCTGPRAWPQIASLQCHQEADASIHDCNMRDAMMDREGERKSWEDRPKNPFGRSGKVSLNLDLDGERNFI